MEEGERMIKVVYFFHRKQGFTVDDFQNYWAQKHSTLVKKIPNVRRYVQCHTLLSGYSRPVAPCLDGVEEICFDSVSAFDAIKKEVAYHRAEDDLENFVNVNKIRRILTREVLMKEGEIHEGMVKLIELVTHKPGMPLEKFHRYWEEVHGPIGAKIKMSKRYVQSHTLMSEYEKDELPGYDGIAEVWFGDTKAMRQAVTTPEYVATIADEKNFVPDNTPFIITHEMKFI
jgi:uncharacterized protein (TIGR02118 family)